MKGCPGPGDLWGKLAGGDAAEPQWHPLVDHSFDVACVLAVLLDVPIIEKRLARAAGSAPLGPVQKQRLAFLAFLHDLGKCSAGFQARCLDHPVRPVGHLSALRPLLDDRLFDRFAKAVDLPELQRWGGRAIGDYLEAVFAHHGKIPELQFRPGSDGYLVESWLADNGLPFAQLKALAAAGRAQFTGAFGIEAPALPGAPAFQHLFAGLLMLADWIGSNSAWFRFSETGDPPRPAFAKARAETVLRDIGFLTPPVPTPLVDFSLQFAVPSPRPAQAAIDGLDLPDGSGSVVLIESETGSGKTEAALRWASRLMAAGRVDGCYFAVPLRSAAVQLHGRMQEWLNRTWGAGTVEALLAVPGYFRMGEAKGKSLPDFRVQWSDDETGDRSGARWAAEQPKRYMAAGFAVGTIDQALMAALAVKHAHLRAACLVRHLLVIDEVHASDSYMTVLSERLIDLFRACGGHVLLMSATLGSGTRERLVNGMRTPPAAHEAMTTAYPRITPNYRDPVDIRETIAEKAVAIEPRPLMDDPGAVAELAAAAAADGARVIVLRNSVATAVETQEHIERLLVADHPALFRVEGMATLHHGRFAAEDRRLLDLAVEARFGKSAPAGAALVVSTQTLEQSLDVDADLLITDLAPVDVLLQRIGRLHRHVRGDRPSGFATPRCVVLVPDVENLSDFLHRGRHGIGAKGAYSNIVSVEASRRLAAEMPVWRIPADNRRLVEQGTHPGILRNLAEELGPSWMSSWQDHFGRNLQQGLFGKANSIDYSLNFSKTVWPDSAEKLATRLGLRDLLLPLDRPFTSPFGNRLTHLRVPRWMAPDDLPEEEAVLEVIGDETLKLGDQTLAYGRHGLSRAKEPDR
ncbi:MAG: CRISPR-associated helicase Cas3' [Geminicoccaceae bacterium]|nr:CRISPR-associated helicase Cas3' [Geminicoccaceae bacterium]